MLDLASIRLFILAVEFGNLTRAAEAAGTVQPVVSARVKDWKRHLGDGCWSAPPVSSVRPRTGSRSSRRRAR